MRILAAVLLLMGCSPSSADLTALRDDLEAGSALAAISQLALQTATMEVATCATASALCTTYPCTSNVAITLGAGCPIPLGATPAGTVNVVATLSSMSAASIASTFVGATTGALPLVVVSTKDVSVSTSDETTTVTYVGQNVDTQGGTLAAQSSWTVSIDDKATPDPSDDSYTLSGTSQATGVAVDQTTVSGAVFDPSCRLNPIGGTATIQHVSLTSVQQDEVRFHTVCDGRVDVGSSSVALSRH